MAIYERPALELLGEATGIVRGSQIPIFDVDHVDGFPEPRPVDEIAVLVGSLYTTPF